jgi:phenylpropionate dioxygenase-like ring-hydroxylating dioxygenase large terminal subunit
MSTDIQDSHLKFSHGSNNAYSGYDKTAIPDHDPELTETDPGTEMGEYMRRFWQPVCLAQELTDVPRAIRILGEDLVAFRDKSGQVGVLHRHCAHRGTSLEYGIIQETGIRCCYHGFEWNVDGTLIKAPGEADGGKRLAEKVSQGAYPAFERGGIVFAYMGLYAEMPKFPEWDFFDAYDDLELVPFTNVYQCNYLQVFDNIPDQIHASHLHSPTMRVVGDDDDGGYSDTALNPVFSQVPVLDYASVRNDTAMVFIAGRRVGTDKIWVRMNDVVVPNMTIHAYLFEDGRDVRYFHRVHLARWYVPIDDENSIVIGWRMFGEAIDPFDAGEKERCGYDNIDFLEGQTGNRPYEVTQRQPGDWEAVNSQRPIAVHAMENPMRGDIGVYMNRRNLRQAVQAKNPHASPEAIHARANAGKRDYCYTHNSVLAIPVQSGRDDDELVHEVCRKVFDIIVAGDDYEGEERDTFIENALKDIETSFAGAVAAE